MLFSSERCSQVIVIPQRYFSTKENLPCPFVIRPDSLLYFLDSLKTNKILWNYFSVGSAAVCSCWSADAQRLFPVHSNGKIFRCRMQETHFIRQRSPNYALGRLWKKKDASVIRMRVPVPLQGGLMVLFFPPVRLGFAEEGAHLVIVNATCEK